MKKVWNIPNLPVYSMATYAKNIVNMNICTYVSSISMKPKLYSIAIYKNTKTLANIEESEYSVLQLLHQSQYNLVNKLGKKSGKEYNKLNYLEKRKAICEWNNLLVLNHCSALILLKKVDSIETIGDHKLFIFETIQNKVFDTKYLDLNTLREMKIIRG